jgi:hypothetical protein
VALRLDGRPLAGTHDPDAGEHLLGVEVRGADPAARPGHRVGLDYPRLEPAAAR